MSTLGQAAIGGDEEHVVQAVCYASAVLRWFLHMVLVRSWSGPGQALRGSEAQRVELITNRTHP